MFVAIIAVIHKLTMFFAPKKQTKSRCGTSNIRPTAVSMRNGLFFSIKSWISLASIGGGN